MKISLRLWFCFTQLLTIVPNLIATFLLGLKISHAPGFKIEPGTLIVANHQSKFDPFLISYHVGYRNWLPLIPIRYPVTHEYMSGGILRIFISLLGGYNIGETPVQRLKGLARTRELLKSKYSVVIFPEGKINYTADDIDTFKRGVEMLFSYNYPVVFVRLEGLNRPLQFPFWSNKQNRSISYSAFYGEEVSANEKVSLMLQFYSNKN